MQELNENETVSEQPELFDETENKVVLEDSSPNNPPWGAGIATVLWLTSVLFIVIIPGIVVVPYLFSQNVDFADKELLKSTIYNDWIVILIGLGGTLIAHILTLFLAWFIVTQFRTYSFREMLGWKWGGFKAWHAAVLIIGLYAIGLTLANLLGSPEDELTRILKSSRAAVFAIAFLATISAPLVEEVVYRGVLYSGFSKLVNVPFAVIAVTVLFAAVHVPQYWGNYATIITICVTSLAITLIRVKTDNLLPCIVFHFIFNGIQATLLILEPYLPIPENLIAEPQQAASIIYLLT